MEGGQDDAGLMSGTYTYTRTRTHHVPGASVLVSGDKLRVVVPD